MSEARFEVREADNGEFFVALVAANNEDVMISETYTTRDSAVRAVGDIRATVLEEVRLRVEEAAVGEPANSGAPYTQGGEGPG